MHAAAGLSNTIKQYTTIGADIIKQMYTGQEKPLSQLAWQICRWHHERWDGRGYPDGLLGESTPISAQVVALADVYDALTSKRCYKDAFDHEKALEMILAGECGAFNPFLLSCLRDIDGNVFSYEVVSLETLSTYDVENMTDGDWDLTLFTCTVGGQFRVTVRCSTR